MKFQQLETWKTKFIEIKWVIFGGEICEKTDMWPWFLHYAFISCTYFK